MSKQNYKVYKGQGYLRLEFDCTNTDINTGTVVTAVINYIKPSGTEGTWSATLEDTVVKYQLANDDIDEEGEWIFQPVITVDGLVGPCDIAKITFTIQIIE